MRLGWLAAVRWELLDHAYGSASDTPDWLPQLIDPDAQLRHEAWTEGFYGNVWHQCSVYSATVAVIPFLVGMLSEAPEALIPDLATPLHDTTQASDALLVKAGRDLSAIYWRQIYAADQPPIGLAEWIVVQMEALAYPEGRSGERVFEGERCAARILCFEALRGAIPLLVNWLVGTSPWLRRAAAELLVRFEENDPDIAVALRTQLAVELDTAALGAEIELLATAGRGTDWAAPLTEALFIEHPILAIRVAAAHTLNVLRGGRLTPDVARLLCAHQHDLARRIPKYQEVLIARESGVWSGDKYLKALPNWNLECVRIGVTTLLAGTQQTLLVGTLIDAIERARTLLFWNGRIWREQPTVASAIYMDLLRTMLPLLLRWLAYPSPPPRLPISLDERTPCWAGLDAKRGGIGEVELSGGHERIRLAHLAFHLLWHDTHDPRIAGLDEAWVAEMQAEVVRNIAGQPFWRETPSSLVTYLAALVLELRAYDETIPVTWLSIEAVECEVEQLLHRRRPES